MRLASAKGEMTTQKMRRQPDCRLTITSADFDNFKRIGYLVIYFATGSRAADHRSLNRSERTPNLPLHSRAPPATIIGGIALSRSRVGTEPPRPTLLGAKLQRPVRVVRFTFA
jgi:hypothetical protein